ncbi:MAG: hypothetical protein ABSF98_08115 [Bryobacteraceae bacterium]
MTEMDIGALVRDVQDLQRRVQNLEQRLGTSPEAPAPAETLAVETGAVEAGPRLPPNALPAFGRALLAIAGAYVLRTLTELGALSHAAGVTAGLVYGVAWLIVAARLPAKPKFPVALSAVTSVAIVAPLLWEASARLNAISSWTCAAVLAGYVVLALALSWRTESAVVPAIVSLASTSVAALLLLATHDLYPFTLALLAMAAALEFEACRGRQGGWRWLAAALADLAVILLTFIASRPELPEGYAAIPAHAALVALALLLAIYAASAVTRTLVQGHCFTLLETAQTMASSGVAVGGAAAIVAHSASATAALGLVALAGGLACYVISFVVVGLRIKWNFRAWATFGLLLVLAGTFLPFSEARYWMLWCGCAVACCWTAMASRRPTLGLHGAVYLLLGALASGVMGQPLARLFGGESGSPRWWWAALVVASALAAWVAVAASSPGETARWRNQASAFTFAAVVTWILAGAATHGLVAAWPGSGAPADTLGTAVLTLLSVGLAWSGMRWQRRELVWLVYGFMALAAWKLVARDFQHEHSLALVVSLLFYGGTLILLPRILQRRVGG